MLTIRLQRVGRKNDPSFRVVVTDSKNSSKSGKFLEVLGSYNARFGKPQLNGEKIKHWLSKGAKASATVNNMLVKFKVIEGATISPLPAKKPEAPIVEAKPVAEVKTESPVPETEAPSEVAKEEVSEEVSAEISEPEVVAEVAEEKTEETTA
jgi:small subunit ribosomal protein S16